MASLELVLGLAMTTFSLVFGITEWLRNAERGEVASSGTVMLAALPAILGLQFLIAFLGYDTRSVPQQPISPRLARTPLFEGRRERPRLPPGMKR